MLKRGIWFCLAVLLLAGWRRADAQMESKGVIIRVMDRVVYIDLGRRDGVQPGDLFDIVSADVLSHPVSGDTLGISPKSVGAIRVLQVYDKMSIAELLHIQAGEDPMLMKIARIQDADRMVDIEKYMQEASYGTGSSRVAALIPGVYQLKTGQRRKGMLLMGLESASLVAGIAYRISSDDWKKRYDEYVGSDINYLIDLGEGMQSRRRWSNRFFWLTGALYAYNWIDALWMRGGSSLSARVVEPAPLSVGMGMDGEGRAMLQVVHRF